MLESCCPATSRPANALMNAIPSTAPRKPPGPGGSPVPVCAFVRALRPSTKRRPRYDTPSKAPSNPPGPGGRPQPVVNRAYSDQSVTGTETAPTRRVAESSPASGVSASFPVLATGRSPRGARRRRAQILRSAGALELTPDARAMELELCRTERCDRTNAQIHSSMRWYAPPVGDGRSLLGLANREQHCLPAAESAQTQCRRDWCAPRRCWHRAWLPAAACQQR